MIRPPHIDSELSNPRNPSLSVALQIIRPCCIADSVESVEQPWLPANGNYTSVDPGRFIDSITFVLSRTEPGAVELQAPKVE
jgi:hypothetical protein